MLHSVRVRLTVWYTAILALVLITFSGISYAFLAREIRAATDAALLDAAREFVGAFSNELPPSDLRLDFRTSGRDIMVLSPSGAIVAASRTRMPRNVRDEVLRTTPRALQQFRTVGNFRVLALPLTVFGRAYTVVVAESLQNQDDRLHAAARAVGLGIPIALLVASAGGYLLARKSLHPVARMSMQAREIGEKTLDQRIAVVNANDELGHLATTLNELLGRLQRAFESQRRFMADASHEMRTPVSIIQGEADVALSRHDRDAAEYRATIEIMRKAALNLTRIVQNLFLLARSDSGTYPIQTSRFYLDEVIADCVRSLRVAAVTKRIALTADCAPDLSIFADEELVRRLLLNLIDNAVKFTPDEGTVLVRARNEAADAIVEVTDSGAGIDAADLPHIFERFFRGDRGRRRVAGSGLGLAIVKWIAEIHGGSASVAHTDSQGTTIRVVLPIGELPQEEVVTSGRWDVGTSHPPSGPTS